MTEEAFQTVELGETTQDVITQFQNISCEYENIAVVLESLLTRTAFRKTQYLFPTLDPKFVITWKIDVEASLSADVQHALGKLDEYVRLHRLKDRASGIEDLLCGSMEVWESSTENSTNVMVLMESSLKCSFCQEPFFSTEPLHKHMQEIHGIFSIQCLFCLEEFESKYKLDTHYKNTHNQRTAFLCPLCKARHCTNQSLQEHCRRVHLKYLNIDKKGNMKLSEGELSKCSECDYSVLRKGRLWTHLEKVHGIKHEMTCETCNSTFASYRLLQHHVMQVHTLVNSCCEICGKKCKNRAALNRHQAMHTQTFNCGICQKIFRDRRSRLQHEKRHNSSEVFSCPHCDRAFNQKANMNRHVKVTHLKEGKLSCNTCSFKTFYKEALKDHINRVHLGLTSSKFECHLCGKSFPKRINFNEHMDKHEGIYNYSCAKCGKNYRNKARCKTHFLKCSKEESILIETTSNNPEFVNQIQNVDNQELDIPLQTIRQQEDLNLLLSV